MPNILNEKAQCYLEQVANQIRWRCARRSITEEMAAHLADQQAAYCQAGLQEEDAWKEAVKQMGDPVSVGQQLDQLHRPRVQKGLLLLVAFVIGAGLAAQIWLVKNGIVELSLRTMVVAILLGGGICFLCYFLDIDWLVKHPVACILLWSGSVWFLIQFNQAKGFQSWYAVSYLFLFCPLLLALVCYSLRGRGGFGLLASITMWVGLTFISVIFLSRSSVVFLVGISGLVILLIAVGKDWFGLRRWIGFSCVCLPVLFGTFYLLKSGYILKRLISILTPETDPMGSGFMPLVLRNMWKNSQWFGAGTSLDEPWQLFHGETVVCDFFLTTIAYYGGICLAVASVALLTGALVWIGILCMKQKTMLGMFLSVALWIPIVLESVLYILWNFGFAVHILSFPFLSYGGISLIMHLGMLGLLLAVFRNRDRLRDRSYPTKSSGPRIRMENGELIIRLS